MSTTLITLFIIMLCALTSLGAAFLCHERIVAYPAGTPTMRNIASLIRKSAAAFLKNEVGMIAIFIVLAAPALFFFVDNGGIPKATVCFFLGAIASLCAGFIGMRTATKANVRTTEAARTSVRGAFRVAFLASSTLGFSVAGMALLSLTGTLAILTMMLGDTWQQALTSLTAFGFGASSIALFTRVGGGIFTKAADIGGDLVGKVEAGIPEDDPRNPAVIADAVGDNVGGVAGAGADLFESFASALIAAMVIGSSSEIGSESAILFPLMIAALGVLASVIAFGTVHAVKTSNIAMALRRGLVVSAVIVLVGGYILAGNMLGVLASGVMTALATGIGAGVVIGLFTEYYTSAEYVPVKHIAKASRTGAATNILSGLALGHISTTAPILVIVLVIGISYAMTDPSGSYGIAIAAAGMVSTLVATLSVGAFGPIVDNANGIAKMSRLPADVRKNTEALDAAGGAALALGRGFSIGAAALTSLALFLAFAVRTDLSIIDLTEPIVLVGLLTGGMLPFLFCSMIMNAIGRAAHAMIREVRRQFKDIPGILEGKAKGNPARCVSVSSAAALREMIAPGILAIATPIVVGMMLGSTALGGLLVGAILTGTLLAISMTNSGGAWESAKKSIEGSAHGGKGTDTYRAAVIGDMIGDSYKDACGPALGILIKLMAIVSLLTAGFYAANGMVG